MTIHLNSQIESIIQQKIASGLYNSADEVVSEALRAMELQSQIREIKLKRLQNDIQEGLDSPSTPWNLEEFKKTLGNGKPE